MVKIEEIETFCTRLAGMALGERVDHLNAARRMLHSVSPFVGEPVDCVEWIPIETVRANDYNPNQVAPPEMMLLKRSIEADGYTQPVVTWPLDGAEREVVDGFHRRRIADEDSEIRSRVHGFLPVVTIRIDQSGRNDRVAATIRHNRARGKHAIGAMAEIVADLTKRNWSNTKIAKELGMDADEVLRLKQVTGLAELFADRDFSEAWEPSSE